jgi:hypothetical protein
MRPRRAPILEAIVPRNGACLAPMRARPPANKIPHYQRTSGSDTSWMNNASQACIWEPRQPTGVTREGDVFDNNEI